MFVTFPAMPHRVTSPYDRALVAHQQQPAPEPGRVVGCVALMLDVLRDLANRPPETLSAAEAKLQGFFLDANIEYFLAIFDQAKEEMIAETTTAARAGVV